MTVKEHYDNHLGRIYSWMTGDFKTKSDEFRKLLAGHSIRPASNKIAIDLGAGNGLQSIPLAENGFQVFAVDFSRQLLDELKVNAGDLNVITITDDIKNVETFADKPELIVCCGDTLTHLNDKTEIKDFLAKISNSLCENGKVILSFRDYSKELTGADRFIPVRSDNTKILTCILDYEEESVNVTDLLYEKINDVWKQSVSEYKKVRLLPAEVVECLEENKMTIKFNQVVNRLTTIIASK